MTSFGTLSTTPVCSRGKQEIHMLWKRCYKWRPMFVDYQIFSGLLGRNFMKFTNTDPPSPTNNDDSTVECNHVYYLRGIAIFPYLV